MLWQGVKLPALFLLAGLVPLRAVAQSGYDQPPAQQAALPAAIPDTKGSELFEKLVENNQARTLRLRAYSGSRTYELRNDKGALAARTVVKMEFHAPGTKTFQKVSEQGSRWVRGYVFDRLMKDESEAAAGREKRDSSITPHNYAFRYLGEDPVNGRPCHVVEAIPTRRDKYLFEGKLWIDAQDFAVAKVEGHPAKNPSFWIKRVNWVRQYGRVGGFWLPIKDDTWTEVCIFGKKHLVIDYDDYEVQPAPAAARMGPTPAEAGQ